MKNGLPIAVMLSAWLVASEGCSRKGNSDTARPAVAGPALVRVAVAPVVWSAAGTPVRLTGVLGWRTEADLSFKVSGIVEAVSVRDGDLVAAGAELARVQLDEIDARVVQARSAWEKAKRDLARVERLEATQVATTENLEDARTGTEQAEAAVRIAEFNRRHAVIIAPTKGRILRRRVEPHELVDAGRVAVRFASDTDGWLVRSNLATGDAARVRVGSAALVNIGGKMAAGKVMQIAGQVDSSTRTVPVEIALEPTPLVDVASSGQVVSVTIDPPAEAVRPVVPLTSLVEGDRGRARIYIVDETARPFVVRALEVQVAVLTGESAALAADSPVLKGAQVVVRGTEYLSDGAAVILESEQHP